MTVNVYRVRSGFQNTATLSITLAGTPPAGNWHVAGAAGASADTFKSASYTGGTVIDDNVAATQRLIATNRQFCGGVWTRTVSGSAVFLKAPRSAGASLVDQVFYTFDIDGVSSILATSQIQRQATVGAVISNTITAQANMATPSSQYGIASFFFKVGDEWSTNLSVTSGGQISWSEIGRYPSPGIGTTGLALVVYGANVDNTATAACILNTSATGGFVWTTMEVYNRNPDVSFYTANAGSAAVVGGVATATGWMPTSKPFRRGKKVLLEEYVKDDDEAVLAYLLRSLELKRF